MYSKPTLLLDEKKCRANIRKMVDKTRKNAVEFRPHFKTHQSIEIGEWFREEGVSKITVSSVDMALYFAQGRWSDITIAFPVNILEIEAINELASSITLNILLESIETVKFLELNLLNTVNAFVKINIGNNRAGLEPDNFDEISGLLNEIVSSTHIAFKGFLGHAGNSYACRSKEELLKVHSTSISHMLKLKDYFKNDYPNLILSIGDTPTCAVAEDFSMIDEMRPGVFVFFDAIMLNIGCCSQNEIATTIACPIVAIHKNKNEIITYGGRVHLASDSLIDRDGKQIFGLVVENKGQGWGRILEDVYVKKISQEHGVISAPIEFIESVNIGDVLKIIPAHICTTSNMFDSYVTTEGIKISRLRL
ncbi:MAG: alanine racemase [Flavobacteriaceae bacterium]|nr:alanine racemase [Flavobacteriaceae bacterium]